MSVEEAQRRLEARLNKKAPETQPAATTPDFVEQSPPTIRMLWDKGEAARPERVRWLLAEIRKGQTILAHLQAWEYRGKSGGRGQAADITTTKDWLANAQHEVVDLQKPYSYIERGEAEQVRDAMALDNEGYVTCSFTISQIIDKDNVMASNDSVWISGVETVGMVDDEKVTLRGMLLADGTRRTTQHRLTDTKGGRYVSAIGAERTIRAYRFTPVPPIPKVAWLRFSKALATPRVDALSVEDPGVPPAPPPPARAEERHPIIGGRR